MNSFPQLCSSNLKDILLFLPRILVLILVWPFLLLGIWLIPALFMLIGVLLVMIFYITPMFICQMVTSIESNICRIFIGIFLVISYPLLATCFCLAILSSILFYPFLRNCIDCIMFDSFDNLVSTFS